jgi:hypothetical protein
MSNIAIWNGTSTFTTGSTPFGFYDADLAFRADADKVAQWCAQRLGYPLVEVELQSGSFYAAFEEAVTTYGNEVYQWKIRENYLNLEGSTTGSTGYTLNNQVVTPNLGSIIRISEAYASEAGAGGTVNWYTGSFTLKNNVQNYDVAADLKAQGITGSIEIKKIFYEAPPAIVRYFDPYAGTGTGIQSLLETFGFGQFSPGINFLLMPIYFDVQKVQAIQLNDQIRKAAFSFDIHNNHVRLFPIPRGIEEGHNDKMFIHYIIKEERNNAVTPENSQASGSLITNVSNVPYANPIYVQINSIGRQWIRQYALATVKEILAYVRGKYSTVPIPGSEVTLNQQDLLTDARAEKLALLEQLRAMLDQTSRKIQLEQQSTEADFLTKQLANVPLPIYFF